MIVRTPPMGWNSWNTFGSKISDELIRTTADAMVDEGLLDAGYNYLVIDDCWAEFTRDENHRLVPSKEKFPNGMKAVADYVHSKGLKFGMYSCSGTLTCAGYPSSYQYEYIDAKTFASWGVDFLKYDYCYRPITVSGDILYKRMGMALANCGRDILFSACNWGADESHTWIKTTGAHMWRSTGDINDSWQSVKDLYAKQIPLQPYNGKGCFNDMDMLIVGMNGKGNVAVSGCTTEEYRTHFSMWAFFGSPLMIGCDIRNMTPETKEILLNKDVIAINQDAAQRQPFSIKDHWGTGNLWVKQLDGGDLAVAFFNISDSEQWPYLNLADIGLDHSMGLKVQAKNLWTGEDYGYFRDVVRVGGVKPHSTLLLRCKLVEDN